MITNTLCLLLLLLFNTLCCAVPVLSFEQCFILFCSFPLLFAFVVGGLGFEFCVFIAGWRHALRSEWPSIIIIFCYTLHPRPATILPALCLHLLLTLPLLLHPRLATILPALCLHLHLILPLLLHPRLATCSLHPAPAIAATASQHEPLNSKKCNSCQLPDVVHSVAFRWRFLKNQTYAEASWVLQKRMGNSGCRRKTSGIPGISGAPSTNL